MRSQESQTQIADPSTKIFSYAGKGITSGKNIQVEVFQAKRGSGINFILDEDDDILARECGLFLNDENVNTKDAVRIKATADFVVNTLRNTVLGINNKRLCIVEHFLAAAALWGAQDLLVAVNGPEMPMADGSARIWIEQFANSQLKREQIVPTIALNEPISLQSAGREIVVLPSEKLKLTYLMDLDHPKIGKCWKTWSADDPYEEIAYARTFGSLKEHELLGLQDSAVSFTEDDFTKPLLFKDEPVRHKLLDLLGDLFLVGLNPLLLKIHVISVKGGHTLHVELARELRKKLSVKTRQG